MNNERLTKAIDSASEQVNSRLTRDRDLIHSDGYFAYQAFTREPSSKADRYRLEERRDIIKKQPSLIYNPLLDFSNQDIENLDPIKLINQTIYLMSQLIYSKSRKYDREYRLGEWASLYNASEIIDGYRTFLMGFGVAAIDSRGKPDIAALAIGIGNQGNPFTDPHTVRALEDIMVRNEDNAAYYIASICKALEDPRIEAINAFPTSAPVKFSKQP